MSHIQNIELEHIETTEGGNTYSYDVHLDVLYQIIDCECSSEVGNQEVTQKWQEVEIEGIDITSYDKFVYNTETELWDEAPKNMPMESEKIIIQKVYDKCDTFELED